MRSWGEGGRRVAVANDDHVLDRRRHSIKRAKRHPHGWIEVGHVAGDHLVDF